MKQSFIKNKWKILTLAGLAFLAFHFIMVLIYVLNEGGVTNRALHYNQKYIVPAFHQKWPLFAPDPANYNCVFMGRYFQNENWSEWLNTDSLRLKHYKIKHMEATLASDLTATINSTSGVTYVIIDEKSIPQFDRLETTFAYHEIYYYFQHYFQRYHTNEMDSIQVRLDYTFASDFYTGEIQEPIHFELNTRATDE